MVFQGYENNDVACKKIIENNLENTAELIKGAFSVAAKEIKKIAFIGGVSKEPLFQERMKKDFGDKQLIFCKEKPVFGALRRAIRQGKGESIE